MADGFGVYEFSGDPDYIASGTMSWTDEGPFTCIECTFFAQFNLVGLDYSGLFLGFDPDDTRRYLFQGFDGFDYTPYGWSLDVVVNPVPLPPALALIAAALLSLAPMCRRRR